MSGMRDFLGIGRNRSHYEMQELGPGAKKPSYIELEPTAPDTKTIPAKPPAPLVAEAKATPKNCTARMLQFLGLHHPEVSIPKKIVQTMWAMLLGLDARKLTLGVYDWIAEKLIELFPPNDPDTVNNFNLYASQVIGFMVAAIAYVYFQRGIGENLKNSVKESAHIGASG